MCHSAGTVVDECCQLCDAVFGEGPDGAVDLPPAAPSGLPDRPLRLSDVIEELRDVGSLVSSADGALELEAACGRLQILLESLRDQFLTDVVIGPAGRTATRTQPVGRAAARTQLQPKRPVT